MSHAPREHVHLLGIGGTGMTALAGLLHASGCRVTGSDRPLYPPMSTVLAEMGVEVYTGYDPAHLVPQPDLIVVGNAISRGNPELEEVLDRRLPHESMARVVSERFLAGRHSVVVAGTHGKTTTSSMLACVLVQAERDPGFLIGGLPLDFRAPFRLGGGPEFVIEGDEYDTAFFDKGPKFMHYRPETVLLGAVEFDHADIYDDLDAVKTAFRRLINLIPRQGMLVYNEGDDVARELAHRSPCRAAGYGLARGTWRAEDVEETEQGTRFRVIRGGRAFADVRLGVPGTHNVLNALAVTAAAADRGVEAEDIRRGLESFRGVHRRLEDKGEVAGVLVLDDFAHHPTAIASTLSAVRRRHPLRRIWAVLEPRSWSMRRNVFQDRLAESFDAADRVLIAGVWGAEAIAESERLDPERLAAELSRRGRAADHVADADAILRRLLVESRPGEVVVFLSNGGFEGLPDRLVEHLRARSAGCA